MNKFGVSVIVALATTVAACGPHEEYTLRTKLSEALNAAAPVKMAVAEYVLMSDGKLPADAGALGIEMPITTEMAVVHYAGGAILVRFGDTAPSELRGRQVAVVPYRIPNSVSFTCGRAVKNAAWEALSDADGAALTTVDARFLPASCR